ncbi:MAG: hypothetical protein IT324_05990 [Anaerolineae bacterium]|nr:hypothetical protein [Anaerolineae bacterium]
MNQNRLIGIILIVVGIVIGFVAAVWLFTNEGLTGPGRILGLGIALLVLVAPLVGGGIYLASMGGKESRQQIDAAQQRKLLNIVQTRGEVKLDDMVLEMQLPRDRIKDMIYSLVGLGVFSGYINWNEGVLYSSEASKLRDLKQCPNCGGEITLTGKGVARCRFCGTEFFLS